MDITNPAQTASDHPASIIPNGQPAEHWVCIVNRANPDDVKAAGVCCSDHAVDLAKTLIQKVGKLFRIVAFSVPPGTSEEASRQFFLNFLLSSPTMSEEAIAHHEPGCGCHESETPKEGDVN